MKIIIIDIYRVIYLLYLFNEMHFLGLILDRYQLQIMYQSPCESIAHTAGYNKSESHPSDWVHYFK